jgi:hypothetical protein
MELDVIRDAITETIGDRLPPDDVNALARRVGALLAEERRRCAKLCRDRMELWRNTAAAKSDIPSVREEARARANEAQYLADALEV